MSLKEKSFKGVFWSFSESIGIKLISVSTFFVLAKLLGVSAFGTVAIVNAFLNIGNLFIEQGLLAALVQKKDLTEDHLNSAFWTNTTFGCVVFIAILFLAPWLAELYELPELTNLIRVASISFLIGPSGLVHVAKLTKEFNFKKIAISRIVGIFIGSVTGIGLALLDYGVWSLVFQQLSFVSISSALIWYFNPWYPKFSFSITAFKEVFSFSYKMFLKSVATTLNNSSTGLLLGYFLGPQAAGYYVFAYKIFQSTIEIANSSINKIMLPLFSSIQQEIPRVRNIFYRALQSAYYLLIPILAAIIFVSPYFIDLFFGNEWIESIPVLHWISIGGTGLMMFYYSNSIFISLGRPDLSLKISVLHLVLNVAIIAAASNFGLIWVAIGQATLPILLFPFVYLYLKNIIGVRLKPLFLSLLKPVASGIVLLLSFWGTSFLEVDSATQKIIIQISISLPLYAIALFIVRAEWIYEALAFIRRKSLA